MIQMLKVQILLHQKYPTLHQLHYTLKQGVEEVTSELKDKNHLSNLGAHLQDLHKTDIYFHADLPFNEDFLYSEYRPAFFNFLKTFPHNRVIYHFDENEELDVILKMVNELNGNDNQIYIENYFQADGTSAAEKNLRKFTAIFSLANSEGIKIYPVNNNHHCWILECGM